MPKDLDDLTVGELSVLLRARCDADRDRQAKFTARLNQEFGLVTQEMDSKSVTIVNKTMDRLSEIVARRLKEDRRTTPLLSASDLAQFIPQFIDELGSDEERESYSKERGLMEAFASAMFENLIEAYNAVMAPGKDPYDENRRWVVTVLGISVERDVQPTTLLVTQEGNDEIVRRMFTREQFAVQSARLMNKFADPDTVKKVMLQPMLNAMAGVDEEERREMEQELEEVVMPQMRIYADKIKVIVDVWIDDEVKRIYGAA